MGKQYTVAVPYSSYVRGEMHVTITADSEEEALGLVKVGEYDDIDLRILYCDDTERDLDSAYISKGD